MSTWFALENASLMVFRGTAAAAVTARRSVSWDWAEDGSLLLRARLPGEQGALLLAALEVFLEPAQDSAGG